jgi:MFS family permease
MKPELKFLLLSSYLNTFGFALVGPLFSLFVLDVGGNAFHAGASLAVYACTAGSLMFLFGKFEDKNFNMKKMIVIGYFILAFGALAFILVDNLLKLYLVLILNAIGVGITNPAWKSVFAKDEDLGKEAEEWAFFDGGNMILTAVATFIGGWLITVSGFKILFLIIFVIQIIAAFLSMKILKTSSI